jgi:fatty-acyl-CoA synthase
VLFFSAFGRVGAVAVPVNTHYKADEARYVIEQSDAKALVMLEKMWRNDYVGMLLEMAPEISKCRPGALRTAAFPTLQTVIVLADEAPPGMITLKEVLQDDLSAVASAEVEVSPDDLLLICYTSGTTGKPKGVITKQFISIFML